MKKIIASVGLATVGTVGLQAAYAPGLSPQETTKPWSVSASLRGFYDDNYVTRPSRLAQESFGLEVQPGVAYNLSLEQTYIKLSYDYTLRYYFDRPGDAIDHVHEFNGKVDHRFSERYRLELSDSFVFAQEPELIDRVLGITTPLRTDGDVLRNRATLNFTAQITEVLAAELGYQNTWYDYSQDGNGSRSALLDRMEHLIHVDGRWQVQPQMVALAGYQFSVADYSSKDLLINVDPITLLISPPGTFLTGDDRDNTSHYFYVGTEYALSAQLQASGRAGVQYTSFDELSESFWSPYVDVRASYTYLPGSYVLIGVRHTRSATDVAGVLGTRADVTFDAQTTGVYASLNHRLTPQITGNLLAQYQHYNFEGGVFDGFTDNLFLLGVHFEYRINPFWAAEAGYNFDRLDSDLAGRSFSRNRVFLGVRARY